MYSQERLVTTMHLGVADKVPVCPRVDLLWLRNAGDALAEEFIRTTDLALAVDMAETPGLYLGAGGQARHKAETRGDRRYEVLETPAGTLTRVVQLEPEMMDWDREHFFKAPEDLARALSIPYEPLRLDFREYREWERRIGREGMVMAHLPDALGCPGLWFAPEEYLVQTCMESTDLVLALLERVNRSIVDIAGQCLDAGIRFFMTSGAELASQTLMGPEWFPRLVAPYDGPVARMIRRAGGYTWCHCHGKIARIHQALADLGIHVLTPCEKPPQGDITLAALKASIGDRVCLAGNLDDLNLLSLGDRDMIRAEALAALAAGMPGGGFMLGGTEGCVFSRTNAESYLYLCEVRDAFGRYPE